MNNIKYNQKTINLINSAIKNYFPHLSLIKKNYKVTLSNISRLVMLDRYSQKDETKKTLKVGDLVIAIIEEHKWFPTRGIGYITKIKNNKNIEVCLEKDYLDKVEKENLIDKNKIKVRIDSISKPLEIYWEQISMRVSKSLAKLEKNNENIEKWTKLFFEQLSSQKFLPAGRILYGAGSNSNVTYFNCFVMPFIEDSRSGISNHRKQVMEIMSRGGGVGTNGSTLRPKDSIAKEVGGKSSGSVSWLNDIASLTHLVEQGGSRRGAQMIMLADWHPDIIEFIISKMQKPHILLWLSKNSKNPLIRKIAKNKIKHVSLSEEEKEIYSYIAKNKNNFSSKVYDNANKKLLENGKWEVINPDFLSGSNISVAISDDFMKAVKKNSKWHLEFPDLENYNKVEKKFYDENWTKYGDIRTWKELGCKVKKHYEINAKDLWQLISFCATYSAEPGVFFIDTANKFTNASGYDQQVVATNPCGEQPLAPYSVCNLGAINLSKFVNKKDMKVNYNELIETIQISIRMQDNVIDATPYFLKENEKQALGERRIGLGVMGLHDLLIWTNNKYGSSKSLTVIDKVFKTICNNAYLESVKLAMEKGSFPFLLNRDKFVRNGFVKTLPGDIKQQILNFGIRNSHLLTIAPTGTTGTLANVSTGLEPYFGYKYYRSGRLGKSIMVESDVLQQFKKFHNIKSDNDPLLKVFVKASDLSPKQHAKVQCLIQKYIDSSISKTVNAPPNFSVHQVDSIYMYLFENHAKGGTVYVDGSRNEQVLTNLTEDKKKKIIPPEEKGKNIASNDEKSITYRNNRIDKEIGTKIGNICPNCKEGTVVESGGCNTCSNCNAQLKCGL